MRHRTTCNTHVQLDRHALVLPPQVSCYDQTGEKGNLLVKSRKSPFSHRWRHGARPSAPGCCVVNEPSTEYPAPPPQIPVHGPKKRREAHITIQTHGEQEKGPANRCRRSRQCTTQKKKRCILLRPHKARKSNCKGKKYPVIRWVLTLRHRFERALFFLPPPPHSVTVAKDRAALLGVTSSWTHCPTRSSL